MNTQTSPLPVASPQPVSRRKALPPRNLLSAHVMAHLRQEGFYLDISGSTPQLISSDEKTRVPLDALSFSHLEAIKHMAHDQYVRAMLEGNIEMDTHRATLNFLSRQLQKASQTPATHAVPAFRATTSPNRRPNRRQRTTASPSAKAA